jgi:hypothetical protein
VSCVLQTLQPDDRECTEEHERYHRKHDTCLEDSTCTCHLVRQNESLKQSECGAYKVTYNCFKRKNIPDRCSAALCMVDLICNAPEPLSQEEINRMSEFCRRAENRHWYRGCARDAYPDE